MFDFDHWDSLSLSLSLCFFYILFWRNKYQYLQYVKIVLWHTIMIKIYGWIQIFHHETKIKPFGFRNIHDINIDTRERGDRQREVGEDMEVFKIFEKWSIELFNRMLEFLGRKNQRANIGRCAPPLPLHLVLLQDKHFIVMLGGQFWPR